jgi:hypothetical protein
MLRKVVVVSTLAIMTGVLLFGSNTPIALAANSAQAANGFQISPVRTEITLNKGQSQTIDVTLTNPTNLSTIATPIVDNFVASSDESGDPRIILNESTPAPKNDFRTLVGKIPAVTIAPHSTADIDVTLSVPSNAYSGGYYGAVRFLPSEGPQKSTVGLTASVGTIFLITVPGDLVEKLNLVQLAAAQNNKADSFITSGPVSVMTRLENVGNIHVQPFGKIEIKDMFGKVIDEYEFNDTSPRSNVLPDSIRRFVDPINKHFFGYYTIQENLGYVNGGGNLINSTASFWYLPIWFLVVVGVVIVGIIALIFEIVTRRRHHQNKRR